MSRARVSVVMPFAGSPAAGRAALEVLEGLTVAAGDERFLVDNSGTVVATSDTVTVVSATEEPSPAFARNAGAERASGEWLLFLDSDVQAPSGLIDSYFAAPIPATVGALAGAVTPADGGAGGLASRYGAAKSFLNQDVHLEHPFMPRAVAANLLVRRVAFEEIGGFFEGVRAAEDTDFSWRLQRAGWILGAAPAAAVAHRYRSSVRALRRQWRGYAAGRAWLGRRYEGFEPEPALARAAGRLVRHRSVLPPPRAGAGPAGAAGAGAAGAAHAGAGAAVAGAPRLAHLALDAVLGVEELAGFALSNRPRRASAGPARVVLVADRFPARGDPLTDYALTVDGARIEAIARPEAVQREAARRLAIDYREDDGALSRARALVRLLARHPLRSISDTWRRPPGAPGLAVIAPAVLRLRQDGGARVRPLGGHTAASLAQRLATLAGRELE